MNLRKASRRWIEPLDFLDARRRADLTRKQAADVLDVTVRTIQNWETGGARIPWLAYRMLRILTGCPLPDKVWEGWTVHGDRLYAPNGRWFDPIKIGNQSSNISYINCCLVSPVIQTPPAA